MSTNKEILKAIIMVSISDTIIDKALVDVSVDGDQEYTVDSIKGIEAAEFEILKLVVSRPDISEGDLSIKQNLAGIKLRLQVLAKSLDKEDELSSTEQKATISSPKVW